MKKPRLVLLVCIALLDMWHGHNGGGQAKAADGIIGRNVVRSIEFDFVDRRTFKEKRLGTVLSFKKGDSVDMVQAEFGREDLKRFYIKKGFAFVEVSVDSSKLGTGAIHYQIKEGPRVKITAVEFVGNKNLKAGELKKVIKSDGKRWFVLRKFYDEERVLEDQDKIGDAYWSRGFLDRQVTAVKEFSPDKSKVGIRFVIDEGPLYIVESIEIAGDEKIYGVDEQLDESHLRTRLKLQAGEVYRSKLAEGDRKRLQRVCRELGFINARVNLRFERVLDEGPTQPGMAAASTGKVNVIFEIFEGEQFRIGRVDITGNRRTRDKVIRRVLDEYEFRPGQYYNADLAPLDGGGELENRLQRMIMAEEVTIRPLAGAEAGQKDVMVDIKEGQTGMVMLGGGVSSDGGLVGQLMFEQRNFDVTDWPESFSDFITGQAFKGAGQSLRIALQPGTEVSENVISFSEPYFQDKPIAFDVMGSDWTRGRESYDEGRLKGSFGFAERYEWRLRDKWRRSIGFRVEEVDVSSIDTDAPKEIKEVEGDTSLLGVKLGIGKNLTDDIYIPSSGYHLKTSYEQVTGEYTFGVLSGTYILYRTLYEDIAECKTILSTRVQAGTTIGDAPMFEKFYGGGMMSIRGFEYRGVSPRGEPEIGGVPVPGGEAKDPIGSDWIFLANAELTVPLVGREFAGLFFIDSGTVETGRYRVSVGTGVQILIPHWFGPVPMRFGVATPVQKDGSDDTEAFFFYIGRLF